MKNQQDLDKILNRLVKKAENRIDAIYAKRLTNILAEIGLMYEKYEVNGVLTMADMSKYNRLSKSMDVIIGELIGTYTEVHAVTQTTMIEQYLEAYFRQAYLAEFEAQARLGFGSLSMATVKAALENPIEFLTLPAILERNRANVIYKIQQEITEGLIAGESYQKIAKRLRDRLDMDKRKSQLVARTESGRAQSIGKEDSYQQAKKYADVVKKWDSALDKRTRDSHRHLDGKEADKDGLFHSSGASAPQPRMFGLAREDIGCRCATRIQVNGREPTVRRVRLEEGDTKVIPWTNYKNWQESRIGEYTKR